jgi:4-hydroxy-3-polyprenylbenzoate decarboxylase
MSQQESSTDLRSWLRRVEREGELLELEGAHWDREMGAISELVEQELGRESPALLFDEIPGYPTGYRTLYNHLGSVTRLATAVGLPTEYDHILDFVEAFEDRTSDVDPLTTRSVSSGPVMENVRAGEDVDLTEIPVPKHHEKDGGRYAGTACCVITRDPDDPEWVNLGTYRCQIRSEDDLFVYISPGKHGRLHRDEYFERDEPMPVVVTLGQHPGLYFAAGTETETGVSELEYAGGVRGEPYEVIEGPETGLPIPADAEIAVEGHVHPGDRDVEGPFGEWLGYYGSGARKEPYARVDGVYFRDDPILTCSPPHKPPQECVFMTAVVRSSLLKQELKSAGVPNVEGVWRHEAGGSRLFNVVQIKQRYAGHARQAAYVAAQTRAGAYAGRWTVVVDEDVDPSDLDEVVWAMSTRCDPETDVETSDRTWSTPLDPMVPAEEKSHPFNSRAIVDATVPYERIDEFPPVAETAPEYREELREKWGEQLPL